MIISSILGAARKLKKRVLRPQTDVTYQQLVRDPLLAAATYHKEIKDYALQAIPYYRDNYVHLDVFPALTKDIIQRHFESLKSDILPTLRGVKTNTSGGATGYPVKFLQDAEYDRFVGYALKYYYDTMLGVDLSEMRKLMIWGSDKDILNWTGDWGRRLRSAISNTRYFNSFSLTEPTLMRCVECIQTFRPDLVRGYASSLFEIARYIKRENAEVPAPRVLISSAEVLKPDMRREIEEAFRTPVLDFYGSRECGALAGECRRGLLHLFLFNQNVEIVDSSNRRVAEGEVGRVLVTTLHNRAMPLMRFEIGDAAVAGPGVCGCGNPLPTLRKVMGRLSENFVRRDGGLVHGEYFTHLFYFRDWVKQFQVVQEDYDRVVLVVSLARGRSIPCGERHDLECRVKAAMGPDCKVEWRTCDEIPPSAHGKRLFTISRVHNR